MSTLDLTALLYSLIEVDRMPDVGNLDAYLTTADLTRMLTSSVWLPVEAAESCTWAASQLQERGLFKHPIELTFDQMVKRICGDRWVWDPVYHTYTKRPKAVA